jgi:hypothetical protein
MEATRLLVVVLKQPCPEPGQNSKAAWTHSHGSVWWTPQIPQLQLFTVERRLTVEMDVFPAADV